ncbi:helix-turn-helix domain-containing protein [Pedobacter ginsengisoli]|uniref:helix-turn-helix domain-containing protein n=1 Tax=Pedobacter ginsengisoli TaxID=363852 RepID=UPI0025512315|nr:helix-turn-helix domain-containing protein [Pedobacter ginsengisoli]
MKAILIRIEKLLAALLDEFGKGNLRAKEPAEVAFADVWLRADEVMELLSISQRTLYNYYISGVFDTRLLGRTRFYSKASVMRLR